MIKEEHTNVLKLKQIFLGTYVFKEIQNLAKTKSF